MNILTFFKIDIHRILPNYFTLSLASFNHSYISSFYRSKMLFLVYNTFNFKVL